MPSTEPYPLFIPPAPLHPKDRREWSPKEAQAYYDWLLSILKERTDSLLTYFGEQLGEPEETLMRMGEKVAAALRTQEFFEHSEGEPILLKQKHVVVTEGGPTLTNRGYALAADMGLLVARLLLEACGSKLRWEILKKPKREFSFNLPVLVGFDKLFLEPVGGCITEAQAVLRGQEGPDVWKRTFVFWKAKTV